MAQKFHFAMLRIEVTRASRGLSAIAELLVFFNQQNIKFYVYAHCNVFTVALFPRDAMLARYMLWPCVGLSVRPFVRL